MDQMFTKAYDNQYTQNKEVFKQLYNSFKRFYSGEDMDISRVIHQVWPYFSQDQPSLGVYLWGILY